jgi:hypothetical protein
VVARVFTEPLGWLVRARMLTLVEGSRLSRLMVVRVRVELCTTGSERRRSITVVRRDGAVVAVTLVRFFLATFFGPFFFLITVTREG